MRKEIMRQYLEQRARPPAPPAATKVGEFGRRLLPAGLRPFAKMTATRALESRQRTKALKLQADGLTRLHLGCGGTHLDGWLNIDLFGSNADAFLDLRKQLPFPDGSIDAIFHEHLLEHFPYLAALRFTTECCRVLKPGGILRIAVPDFRRFAQSYLGETSLLEERRPDRPSSLLAFSEIFYEHGHCSMWDVDTLEILTRTAGFCAFAKSAYSKSALGQVDSSNREPDSLYVEATR